MADTSNDNAANTVANPSPTSIAPGDTIMVGSFFWINEPDFIGYDRDAKHGHGLDFNCPSGSVDIDCSVTVRAIQNGYAVVRLNRPDIPFGAPAPIGTVFQIPLSQIAEWPEQRKQRRDREEERLRLAGNYCR